MTPALSEGGIGPGLGPAEEIPLLGPEAKVSCSLHPQHSHVGLIL